MKSEKTVDTALLNAASRRARAHLEEAILRQGGQETYASLSHHIGRNHAYIQQHIQRGSPKFLSETDIRQIAMRLQIRSQDLSPPRITHDFPVQLSTDDLPIWPNQLVTTSQSNSKITLPINFLFFQTGIPLENLFAFRVRGDAMVPTFNPGDMLVFQKQPLPPDQPLETLLTEGLFIVAIGSEWQPRRVVRSEDDDHAFRFCSDNTAYTALPVSDFSPGAIAGRILWAGRRLT